MPNGVFREIKKLNRHLHQMSAAIENLSRNLDSMLREISLLDNNYPRAIRLHPDDVVKPRQRKKIEKDPVDEFTTIRTKEESKALTEKIIGSLVALPEDEYMTHRDITEILWNEYEEPMRGNKTKFLTQVYTRLTTLSNQEKLKKIQSRNKQNQTISAYRLEGEK